MDLKVSFSRTTCTLIVSVWDAVNSGNDCSVTLITDSNDATLIEKVVPDLGIEVKNVEFEVNRDGLVHRFEVRAYNGVESRTRYRHYVVC